MNILMLAPEPFFQPRGTPISIYFRLKALSALGHHVDLITYHLGEDRSFPRLRILRIPDLFRIRTIRIGPSWTKIPLDALLLLKAAGRLGRRRYDLIFSHEEAALFGAFLGRIRRTPHVYDMHSSLPQQLKNFRFSRSRMLIRIFQEIEGYVLRHSDGIIVICPDLLRQVREAGQGRKAVLLENFLEFDSTPLTEGALTEMRGEFALPGQKIVLYTGNFQPYQGIPLLLGAAALMTSDPVIFLLVGETSEAVSTMRERVRAMGLGERVRFTGQVPPERIPHYLQLADALVSPRLSGTNTPLKIYSFLKSGKPVVATDLWTHTQVLNHRTAVLVKPEPRSLARGLREALFTPAGAERARNARELAESEHTISRYMEKLEGVLRKASRSRRTP